MLREVLSHVLSISIFGSHLGQPWELLPGLLENSGIMVGVINISQSIPRTFPVCQPYIQTVSPDLLHIILGKDLPSF